MLLSNKLCFTTALLFLVLLSATWTQAQSDTPKVEGYVYDANAKPMKKVEVRVYYPDGAYAKSETDEKGHYSVLFTKNTDPIRVRYFPKEQVISFSDLRDLSGSTNHSISRTQQRKTGVYSVSTLIQLNNDAQEALSSAKPEDKAYIEKYYRALLSNVRLESGAVANEPTIVLVQTSFNETRRQYGMGSEQLKTEKGEPVFKGSIQISPRSEPDSCMTFEVLREMVNQICYGEPPSITGLSRSDALTLRRSFDCRSGIWRPPNPRDRP